MDFNGDKVRTWRRDAAWVLYQVTSSSEADVVCLIIVGIYVTDQPYIQGAVR